MFQYKLFDITSHTISAVLHIFALYSRFFIRQIQINIHQGMQQLVEVS